MFEGVSDRQSDCECRRPIEGDADRGHQENQEQDSAVVLVELRRRSSILENSSSPPNTASGIVLSTA
jgi:hypothetical protein